MEIDLELLHEIEQADEPYTVVRFYQWDVPTVSLGTHQDPERAVDLAVCQALGVPVVHRPTGGRAVLHADELTYAVISNDPNRFPLTNLDGTYLTIARVLSAGFRSLGIHVDLAPGGRETQASRNAIKNPCFASASRHELLFHGRKVAGSAQRRLRRSFLQHGSIPLNLDYEYMARVLGTSGDRLRLLMTCVSEAAGRPVKYDCLRIALQQSFIRLFEGTKGPEKT